MGRESQTKFIHDAPIMTCDICEAVNEASRMLQIFPSAASVSGISSKSLLRRQQHYLVGCPCSLFQEFDSWELHAPLEQAAGCSSTGCLLEVPTWSGYAQKPNITAEHEFSFKQSLLSLDIWTQRWLLLLHGNDVSVTHTGGNPLVLCFLRSKGDEQQEQSK